MREIDARVTGFDYTTHHSYTTQVEVDGRSWSLGIRYNTFFQFYTRLTALEKHFNVEFPPKGGLFFSPPPEERQEQLDEFLLSTLAYFDMRGHPRRMEALLGELLQIPQHLGDKDDNENTASEGSTEADELLQSSPMPSQDDVQDFHEDAEVDSLEDHMDQEDNNDGEEEEDKDVQKDNNAEEDEVAEMKPKPMDRCTSAPEPQANQEEEKPVTKVRSQSVPEPRLVKQASQELTGGRVANKYIEMLRRKNVLVHGAMQAAVVSTMQQNVAKANAAKLAKASGDKKVDITAPTAAATSAAAPLAKAELVTPEESVKGLEITSTELLVSVSTGISPATTAKEQVASSLIEDVSSEAEGEVAGKESALGSPSRTDAEPSMTGSDEASGSEHASVGEDTSEASTGDPETEAENENPVLNWFRRMGTFGQSSVEKDDAKQDDIGDQEAAAPGEGEDEGEAEVEAEAEAKLTQEDRKKADEAEKVEAELLRAEQELNLRLMRYRHPVFFQNFNCDVGTSRYSLPERRSDGIVV